MLFQNPNVSKCLDENTDTINKHLIDFSYLSSAR